MRNGLRDNPRVTATAVWFSAFLPPAGTPIWCGDAPFFCRKGYTAGSGDACICR